MESDDEKADFLTFGQELVEPREIKVAGTSTVDFDGLLHTPLRLNEDLAGGCGGQLWPAGMTLAKYLLRHEELLADKSIVELGAGGGLVGLAVALACRDNIQKPLHITDQLPMLALMNQNIGLNGLEQVVQASIYDWGEAPPANIPRQPDVILAADCVYFEPAFPLLLQTLEDLIGEQTICYFCFKKRRRADMHFIKNLKKKFAVSDADDDPDRQDYSRDSIFLYKMTRK